MGLFGSKPEDGMKEFERMRRSLRPAARTTQNGAAPEDDEDGTPLEPGMSNVTVQPLPAHHVAAGYPAGGREVGAATYATAGGMTAHAATSIIGPGSAWQGTLAVDGSLRIQGQVTGEILVRDAVHIAEGAEVDAKVRAAVVVVAGYLHGEIEASERLEIGPTGRVQANLVTKALVVHDGAVVEGQLRMVQAEPGEGAAAPSEQPRARTPITASSDHNSRTATTGSVAALPTVESAAVA
jgi:cytoskeletal protein CcmA (bactofilin family)